MLALTNKKLMVLAVFATDYYDGQWSRLYRLQCRARNLLRSYGREKWFFNDAELKAARRTKLYRELVTKYADDKR